MKAMSWLVSGALLLLASCGGTEVAPSSSATTAATSAAKSASTAGAAATAVKAASTAAATAAAKAGATAADACALLTVEEVGRVMGATGVKAEGQPELAGATYCTYRDASGNPIVATSYLKAGAAAFNAVSSGMQAQSGIGDRAQWDDNSATLQVLKGQTVHAITAGDGRMANPQRLDLAKQLGQIAAARQ
ncbi:MAG: hypothetical protein IT299_04440 [Dehalococcoidia bacterium]|nr:hypothetical protein [Dehalococcoidia bacterium]